MFRHTYTKFYVIILLVLLLGFASVEFMTSGATLQRLSLDGITGYAAREAPSSDVLTPTNMVFLFTGVTIGAFIVGTAVYIYTTEKR